MVETLTTNYRDVPELQKYIDLVENEGKNGVKKCCKWQKKLIKFVKKCFENENLTIDTEQLKKYMGLQNTSILGCLSGNNLYLHCIAVCSVKMGCRVSQIY